MIYSLNYPERPRALAPDADETIETLRDARRRAEGAGRAGEGRRHVRVRVGGLDRSERLREERGEGGQGRLPEDAAIRALTIDAAKIAGAGDRLGSIEKGKIANLIVTDGDLFDEKTKITRVFVEGRSVALDAPAAPGGRGRGRGGHRLTLWGGRSRSIPTCRAAS